MSRQNSKKPKKKGDIVLTLALIVAVAVFLFCRLQSVPYLYRVQEGNRRIQPYRTDGCYRKGLRRVPKRPQIRNRGRSLLLMLILPHYRE